MKYKKVAFVAPAWREKIDKSTNTLYVQADFSKAGYCDTLMTPIPGSDPPEYTYECLPVTCEGECKLRSKVEDDGTVIWYCECIEDGAAARTSSKAKRGSAKASSKPKKKAKKKSAKR